jgi:nucleoside-diphosphate-sugar epimerase
MKQTAILVTGACGQLGTELVAALRRRHRAQVVIATDVRAREGTQPEDLFYTLNVLDQREIERLVRCFHVKEIYHLAAVLSARGEANPRSSWQLNMEGLLNVLEVAQKCKVRKIFWPSSIAVFGHNSHKAACPQGSPTDPGTMYGITKLAGEQICKYYREKMGLDIRSIRYPGLVSHSAKAGGGTTDYAVDIFHQAVEHGHYTCFLREHTGLPMMYMADAVRAALLLMGAERDELTVHTSYNLSGLNFTPRELAAEIRKHIPDFEISYAPDFRQQIADSWPSSIDDRQARRDWGWQPAYDLPTMVTEMLNALKQQEYAGHV